MLLLKIDTNNINIKRREFKCLAVRKRNDTRLQPIRGRKSSEKTGIKRNNISILFLIFCFLIFFEAHAECDSLWTDDFKGYLSSGVKLKIGDIVIVEINTDFSLVFSSSSKDSKALTLEFSGGEYGSLFSFLPSVSTGGNQKVDGKEEYSLKSGFVARVIDINTTGHLFIRGSRNITIEGKTETLTLSGWIDPGDMDKGRKISFSRIADSRLIFRSFLKPAHDILTEEDIKEIFSEISGKSEIDDAGTTLTERSGAIGDDDVVSTTDSVTNKKTITLTDSKKKELLLLYINRLIDIIFR